MTPKEKATELYKRFEFKIYNGQIKDCVLICVDEIIKSNPISPSNNNYQETEQDRIDDAVEYWNEVKKEIEKM